MKVLRISLHKRQLLTLVSFNHLQNSLQNNTCSRVRTIKRFMKRMTIPVFSQYQKQKIALHVQELITYNFQQPFQTRAEFLANNVRFMTHEGLPEDILNQTLVKAAFPRYSDSKANIVSSMVLSKKLHISYPKEKTDFRFIPEIKTASTFAESYECVEEIRMNTEHPNNMNVTNLQTIFNTKNKYKDITLQLRTDPPATFDLDVKSGNNANNPFSGILANIPLVNGQDADYVLNRGVSLAHMQDARIKNLPLLSSLHSATEFEDVFKCIRDLNTSVLDPIEKNHLIQQHLFNLMSKNLLVQQPSFYNAFLIGQQPVLNKAFFEKLSPHIEPTIFDNRKNAQIFIKKAIRAYSESIEDIYSNITKSKEVWTGTGFENIADDIFQ
jgi:hypothetical protein